MDFITFLQNASSNINSSILSLLNLVLLVELTVAFILGMRLGFLTGEATTGKITELGLYAAMLFGAWQYWPHELVLLTMLPQCAFWVFVGGLVGCTFRWGVERAFLRS
ncbi:hypothetical protein QUB47_07705 [Microcoleus sp. AT9_B5]